MLESANRDNRVKDAAINQKKKPKKEEGEKANDERVYAREGGSYSEREGECG